MHTALLTTSISLTASVAFANPGALISSGGSIDRSGDVLASSVAADGEVTLAGLFYRVGEMRVPGVARLRSSGVPDAEFSSAIGISPPEPPLLTGQPSAQVVPCPVVLAFRLDLAIDGVILGDPPMGGGIPIPLGQPLGRPWFVLGGNGQLLVSAITSIAPQEPVLPQFVEDGKLVAIVNNRDAVTQQWVPRVRRLRMDTGRDDEGFSTSLSGLPFQAAPAGDGGMWVLANESGSPRVTRLTASGAPLGANSAWPFEGPASLLPLPAGMVAVKSEGVHFDPVAGGIWGSQIQFLNADGTGGLTRTFPGGVVPFSAAPDGSTLVYERDNQPGVHWRNLWRALPDGTRDAAFHTLRTRRSLLHLDDGRMLADGTRRYLADGRKDPAWAAPEPMDHGIVEQLFAGPGGTVYGTGDFTVINGAARPGIARWQADGTLDASFAPAAAEGEVVDCAPLTGGGVAVLRRTGNETVITRLQPDGTGARVLVPGGILPILAIEPLPGDAVLVQDALTFCRIESSGEETWRLSRGPSSSGAAGLAALPDGRFFSDGRLWSAAGVDGMFLPGLGTASLPLCAVSGGRWLFLRNGVPAVLGASGSADFTVPAAGLESAPACAAAGPGRTFYFAQHGRVTRHYADGRRDASFRPVEMERRNESIPADMPLLSALQNGGAANAHAMLLHPVTGALWVAGDFTRVNGAVSPGLALIYTEIPGSFTAWSAAIFTSPAQQAADADPDNDGVTNWQEYAAGSDPQRHDPAAASPEILTTLPLCISAPLNPQAPEIYQVPEVSTDLRTWRTASGAEAVRKTVNGRPAFELARGAGTRFVRIRYRSAP